jgi:methylase of polypeptide subunit release factors
VTRAGARPTRLRAVFDRAGYDEERIAAALHVVPPATRSEARANRARLGDDPLSVLVRLFVAGEPVPRELVDGVLLDAGLVRECADGVEAPFAVTPFAGALVVHDHERWDLAHADHVAGVAPATRTLAATTVRRRARRALELGTGCGAVALVLARHADEVVATDINPRALELAATTLRLNDVDNVELREGSFFEAVAAERFDVIATNPPWVVSPDSAYLFRDAGFARDDLSRMFVTALPEHLEEAGIGTSLVCWLHGEDEEWSAPVRRWLDGSGCDAVVVRYAADDPVSYATKWNADDADRWIACYREQRIERFATGVVVLRRGGSSAFVALDAEAGPSGSASDQLLRILAALDFDGDLAGERLALAPHRLEERLAWTGSGYAPERLVLRLDDGLGVEAPVDPAALPALFQLDGSRPLHELPRHEDALPTIRRLLQLGFVERL